MEGREVQLLNQSPADVQHPHHRLSFSCATAPSTCRGTSALHSVKPQILGTDQRVDVLLRLWLTKTRRRC